MRNRIVGAFLGLILIGIIVAEPVLVYATEDAEQINEVEQTGAELRQLSNVDESISTATQTDAVENEEDIDEDIYEEVSEEISKEWEEIEISSAEDLVRLAESCKLDTWSVNKKVILTNDISLTSVEFEGISTFGGYFDGQGYTISNVNLSSGLSYTGLISHLQNSGAIKDLTVTGTVAPTGSQIKVGGIVGDNEGIIYNCSFNGAVVGSDYIGGIAGINELTGIISDCNSEGYIHGTHFTGGIAGENMGNILNCENKASVNTTNIDTQITIDAMSSINTVLSIIQNGESSSESANANNTSSDTGGIAGQSIGIIDGCLNVGDVGYEHVGYNVGGIAGRQSGYVLNCTNNGKILGRKDIGGIVGQAEPYITVDLSSDIAYQLSEAIDKLHDIVTVTLKDAKNQSNVISNRLTIIQQYTSSAIEDARYIANGTVDYANGVSGAATDAFSRLDYILEESSKEGGVIDQLTNAGTNARQTADNLITTVKDVNLESYMSDEEKATYNTTKDNLEAYTSTYSELYAKGYNAYYNKYVDENKGASSDLKFSESFSSSKSITDYDYYVDYYYSQNGYWYHDDENSTRFPDSNNSDDTTLNEAAIEYAATNGTSYANTAYSYVYSGHSYNEDVTSAVSTITAIITPALEKMEDKTRSDALSALNSAKSATDNLSSASSQTKSIVSTVAGYDSITFPQFSSEYKERTNNFANNMQAMNDNFGLLNNEMNNASGVLIDDLQAMADQFNTIMMLYTDAVDGVLEMDYTSAFEDVSLAEAEISTDATIDSCINYGKVEGDINTAGIAGTMAIEYDYDQESDITGISDSRLNSSYITKCVLRDNINYGEAVGEKSYVGGVCGMQEMGTIIGCCNYSNIKSSSGEYIGGIAGSSLSYVVSSFSKGILSGKSYVGGIAGDGMHIRDSFSLISISDADSWYGAIAGHVGEQGIVRNNFFVSSDLSGIDRISYSKKAEPISYDDAVNEAIFAPLTEEDSGEIDENTEQEVYSAGIPAAFKQLTVTYVLEDDDLDDIVEISKEKKKYGDSFDAEEYPEVENKDGYYVTWDVEEVESIVTDMVITATYTKYRTTLAENDNIDEDVYQSEILVDGQFKAGDEFKVDKTIIDGELIKEIIEDKIQNYGTMHLVIPDDGSSEHTIRFKPNNYLTENGQEYTLYQIVDEEYIELASEGNMGEYKLYNIAGNEVDLAYGYNSSRNRIISIVVAIVIGAIIVFFVLVIITVIMAKKHGRLIPKMFRKAKKEISKKIESKEQLFYDESNDSDTKK